ncbi:MAG: hypothetical protein ACNS60_17155 [Candidatus Cyclobacteriaceae bacterium M2_1C_046]
MKDYSKLVSAILLLFLVITIHHYSNILYNKITQFYPDTEVRVDMSLPAIFLHEENNQDVILPKEHLNPFCAKSLKNDPEKEVVFGGV